jgi:hypothetical protein
MPSRRFAGLLGVVACLTIVLYGALVVLATGCASMPLSASRTHHHSEQSAHSPLCAWSCQMMSQSGLVVSVPDAVVSLAAISVVIPVLYSHPASPSASRSSRAPPVFTLGLFRRNAFLDCVSG